MIISASRRTDIPAFYSEWMINRIREGYCCVPNPFNSKQVSYIPLDASSVEAIVFWTRNAAPLMKYLEDMDGRNLNYYFQYSILGYPRELDPKSPSVEAAVETFRSLSETLGKERVIWRYDPIVFTPTTDIEYHCQQYERIGELVADYTTRSVISIVDDYRKARGRMKSLPDPKFTVCREEQVVANSRELGVTLKSLANSFDLDIESCSETIDLSDVGICAGKCVDDKLIRSIFGETTSSKKDKNQREQCGCVESRDIGMYDSCLYGCQYCYATQSFERAAQNLKEHDPSSPSLLGRCECEPPAQKTLF
jgi:hypothetical protein